MRNSHRSREGYLMVDHRNSPGIGPKGSPLGPGSLFEAPTVTCSHCQRIVVINPLRTRARGYCPKCDCYLCDECEIARVASAGDCRTFNELAEAVQEGVLRDEQRQRGVILVLP